MEDIDILFLTAMKAEMVKTNQKTIAYAVGLSIPYINEIHSGKKKGSEKVRRRISKAFGYEYEDFLNLGRVLLVKEAPAEYGSPQSKEAVDSITTDLTPEQTKVLQDFRYLLLEGGEGVEAIKAAVSVLAEIKLSR